MMTQNESLKESRKRRDNDEMRNRYLKGKQEKEIMIEENRGKKKHIRNLTRKAMEKRNGKK